MKKYILFAALFFATIFFNLQAQLTYTFNYTGASQTLALPAGLFSVQCWGGNGGTSAGGSGGYTTGSITITSPTTLHVYVGGAGSSINVTGSSNALGGWNGGGNGSCYSYYGTSGGGGGGTDIRTTQNTSYANRIIVAGGGGGGSVGTYGYIAGNGGGTSGNNGTAYGGFWYGRGGTQSAGGAGTTESNSTVGSGSLGIGGSHVTTAAGNGWVGCGGGGGYYGGSAGGAVHSSGGGGSGYIGSGMTGSTYVSGQSGFVTNPVTTGHGLVIVKEITGFSISQVSPIICAGQANAVLSATVAGGVAPYTFTWSTGATTNTIGGLGAGTYTCWATSASAVTYSGTFTVAQPSSFSAYINTHYDTFCNGGSDGLLSVSISGGVYPYSYSWTPFGGNQAIASGLSAGIYSCNVSDANGCVAAVTGTVNQPPAPSIIAFATSSAICIGQSVTLIGGGSVQGYSWTNGAYNNVPFTPTATANYVVTGYDYNGCPGYAQTSVIVNPIPTVSAAGFTAVCPSTPVTLSASGANTYSWSGGALSATTVVSPTASTIYTVTGTNSYGCQSTATVFVSVYVTPLVSAIVSSSVVCSGSSVTMSGSGAASYTWSGGVTNAVAFTPTASSVYTLSGTNINGCVRTATYHVIVNPLPSVSITGNTAICQGNTSALYANGAGSYTWSNGVQTNSALVSPASTSVISVTGSDANGCLNSASLNIVVTPLPPLSITSSGNFLCIGRSMTLLAGGASSYTWLPSQANSVSVSVNPTVTSSYTLLGNANGCDNSTVLTISVVPLPTLSVSGPTVPVCALNSVTLFASGASTYSWNNGPGSSTISVTPSVTTVYSVTGGDANGCTKTDTIRVNIKPIPNLTVLNADSVVCSDESATLTVSGALSYTWSTADTAQTIVVNPPVSTSYSVSGTGANGCTSTTNYLLVITSCSGILETTNNNHGLLIYPNPSNGVVHIQSQKNLRLRLVDAFGQLVKEMDFIENNGHVIDLSQLSSGIYFVVGTGNEKNIKEKIVITN